MNMISRLLTASAMSGLMASGAYGLEGVLTTATSSWSGTVDVTGNITVPAGVTLTINPGARVRSAGGAFSITATGPVKAVGTLANFIDIYGVSVILKNSATPHDLQYIVMLNDQTSAIWVDAANAKLAHIQIQDFGTNGVSITGATAKVNLQFSTIGAKSRLFGGAEAVSVLVGGGADAADIEIANNILGFENKAIQTGLAIKTAAGVAATSTTVKVHHNLITGTRVGTGTAETGNLTDIDSDVKDIPNLDYHLWPYSPAINMADPAADFTAEPAPNGGRADLGYYGGTAGASSFAFRIVTPNGGDSLTPGQTHTIKWQGGKLLGAKKIDFSTNNGATWTAVTAAADAAGAGTHAWTIPTARSTDCLVRVSLADGSGADQSDRVFTIGDTTKGGNTGTLKDPTPFRCIPFSGYRDGQAPGGAEPSLAQVKSDLELIKPLTREIRTYGCGFATHGSALPLLCDQLGMKLHMGIWIDDTYTEGVNQASILDAIQLAKDNHPSIKTVIVGNEFLLRVRQAHKDEAAAEAKLVRYIKQVRAALPTTIVVTTGESYPDWLHASDELVKAVDVVTWHVHPWWEQKAVDNAGNHAYNVWGQMKARIAKVPGHATKRQVLGETGWPSGATTGAAVGSEANQTRYLKDLHAWAKKEGLEYWYFTNVDEKWKGNEGAVGSHWGMYNADRTPKAIIGSLNDAVPPAKRWENDIVVGIRIKPLARAEGRSAVPGMRIYDINGRLLGAIGDEAMLGKTRQAAAGVVLADKRLR